MKSESLHFKEQFTDLPNNNNKNMDESTILENQSSPRATDFSIAAIIGRSGRAAAAAAAAVAAAAASNNNNNNNNLSATFKGKKYNKNLNSNSNSSSSSGQILHHHRSGGGSSNHILNYSITGGSIGGGSGTIRPLGKFVNYYVILC